MQQLLGCGAGVEAGERCISVVVDAAAAAKCIEAGSGAVIELELGHTIDSAAARLAAGLPPWGPPLVARGTVHRAESNARFTYTGRCMLAA